jgi:fibroblast growth factor receptor 1
VLLFEIVTLGAVPYSSINVENLLKFLHTGLRLERPAHCHILLYELMMLCWHANPLDRPAFDELSAKLHSLLLMESSWGERIIDLSKMFNKCMSDV